MSFHEDEKKIYKNRRKELSRYRISSLNEEASLTSPGSLTVEAALILPFFLMVMMGFLSLFYVLAFQLELQKAMDRAVQKAAVYYYAVDLIKEHSDTADELNGAQGITQELLEGGVTAAYLRAEILSQMDEKSFERARVWNKKAGITFLQSEFPDNQGAIDLVVSYQIKIPFLPGDKASLFMTQRSRRMAWTGNSYWGDSGADSTDSEKKEAIVYVTEHGSVYHTELTCSYLRLKISSVNKNDIGQKRNKNGESYSQCEKCPDMIAGFYFYITESGNRYHNSLRCPGLTRNIKQILLSEVGGRPLCSRCGN